MKFLSKLNFYKNQLINEADEEAPLPPNTEENPTPQEAQQTEEQPAEPEQQTKELTPEGEVLLIRLLKKAFVISPKPEDIEQMSDIDNINENNARESLSKIIGLMKKYSTDIELDID
jgi:hypothetical protein